MKTSEILAKAADEIESRGLHKGSLAAANGKVCVLGAMQLACGGQHVVYGTAATVEGQWGGGWGDHYRYNEFSQARTALQRHLGTVPSFWNDLEETTQDEVVSELRQASAVESERELAG